jgi:hypothetical protein
MPKNKPINPDQASEGQNSGHKAADTKLTNETVVVRKVAVPSLPQGPYKPKRIIKVVDPEDIEPAVDAKKNNIQEEVQSEQPDETSLDDQATDEAVDDIAEKESDTILALEDAKRDKSAQLTNKKPSWKARLSSFLKNKWTWTALALLLLIIFAIPVTRYAVLGLVIKEPVNITLIDSRTGTPVSGAGVKIDGVVAITGAGGKVHLKAGVGRHTLLFSKQYYKSLSEPYFVSFKPSPEPQSFKLIATGRLVPITVLNRVTGQPLAGAEIKLKGTTARTNKEGRTYTALPTSASSYPADLRLNGYNPANITVMVTNQVVKANSFDLTPAGHIYFLSSAGGTINVDEANLDGSNSQIVLAGTGQENSSSIRLLASSDWRYLVLESSRSGGQPALYLIDTSDNKVTEFDNSGGNITLIGWSGHYFMYDLVNPNESNWQTGREAIKSYDADNMQLNELDENQAEGSPGSYAYQTFSNFNIVSGLVVYATQWNTGGTTYNTTGKSDTIRAVSANGQNKKDYQSFPANSTGSIEAQPYSPQGVYFSVAGSSGGAAYYNYDDQAVQTAGINSSTFNSNYPVYYVSPNGNQSFWTQLLGGQDAFFTGNNDAAYKKQIASLSGYSSYGWYGNNYILLSKNSRLYIMSSSGLKDGQQPFGISSYSQP